MNINYEISLSKNIGVEVSAKYIFAFQKTM